MKTLYLVTGAAGHLGNTVVRRLLERKENIRTLVLPHESNLAVLNGTEIFEGDIRDAASLIPFFHTDMDTEIKVIHCAGVVTIASKFQQNVYDVNVTGTKNVVERCMLHPRTRLIHISSVHAIPELPAGHTMTEICCFDPDKVTGLYAKTKAEATQYVLNACRNGLNASVVHPSGICGPFDYGRGHITQLFKDYCRGTLTAGVNGAYDFCDVRDVADGILSCMERGKQGECYILSGNFCTIPDLLELFHEITGKKRVKTILPMWFAKLTAPLSEIYYKILKQPPLYTAYSLYTLTSNARFSNEKAKKELGYSVRPMRETIADMMNWMKIEHLI